MWGILDCGGPFTGSCQLPEVAEAKPLICVYGLGEDSIIENKTAFRIPGTMFQTMAVCRF